MEEKGGEWTDWLGVTRLTFFAALGAVIAAKQHHNQVYALVRPGIDLAREREARQPHGDLPRIERRDLYPDAMPVLRRLRAAGLLIGLAGNQAAGAAAQIRALGLPVDFVASSARWGVEKPDPAFFVVESGVASNEIAYVGDRLDNDVLPRRLINSLASVKRRSKTGAISMKFGIHNPSWVFGPDPTEAFERVKAKAQWAENHGFVWFSVMDHLIQIGGVGAPDEPFMEGWTVLSGLAAVTSRIRLATLATSVGYRNPAHLAKIAAGVDLISRGRLTLGIGAGYLETEYRQYGWEFPARPAVRIRQMEEAVRLILALWTERRTTFHGRYFHAEDAILEPKPVQKPRPPVMIAGGGEQLTLRAVARLGDACNVGGDPEIARHKLGILRGHCDTAQRDYDAIEKTHNNSWLLSRDAARDAAKRERLSGRGPLRGFVGTVSEAVDLIGQYRDAGMQLLINSDYRNDMETHELMAAEVMPHFA